MNIVQTLYSLPTVIIGLLLFLLISSSGPFGQLDLLFTPAGMIIGQALLILPILIGLTIAALAAIDPLIRDTLASLGATGWQQLFALLREARFAILAVVALAFGRAISEVGVAIMIGGNIRGYHARAHHRDQPRDRRWATSRSRSRSVSSCLSIALVVNARRQPPAGGRARVIRCEKIGWDAGEKTVLDGISLEVAKGESFGLIGPSGGGRARSIRILDLLIRPTRGQLWIGDGEVTGGSREIIALRRRMALVFQRPVAFQMNVSENVAYGLALRHVPRNERRTRVAEALELVGLGGLEERRASTLSGGELQRVSIARCLVTDPEVLFLDEPTANLDPLSTHVIEEVVAGLRKDRGITVVMATHNLEQGQRLCDRLAVMAGGRLVQIGTPLEIFYRPMSIEVAQFVGAENLVEGVVERMDRGVAFVRARVDTTLAVAVHAPVMGPVTVAIRPEEIVLARGSLPAGQRKPSPRNG